MKMDVIETNEEVVDMEDIIKSLKYDSFPNEIREGYLNSKGEVILKRIELPIYSKELENSILQIDFQPFFLSKKLKEKYHCEDKERIMKSLNLLKNSDDPISKYYLALLCVDFKKKRYPRLETCSKYHFQLMENKEKRSELEELMFLVYCNIDQVPTYILKRDWYNVVTYAQEAASKNYGPACSLVGYCYLEGVFLHEQSVISIGDYLIAYKWFRKAIQLGVHTATAEFGIAKMFDEGWGVLQSYSIALKYYIMSAKKGYEGSFCNIGFIYERGNGVKKNEDEGLRWYLMASERGSSQAICNLGYIMEKRGHVNLGFRLYLESALEGNIQGLYNVGCFFLEGLGVQKDYNTSAKWFQKATEYENFAACCNLAYLYDEGLGVPKNGVKARELYEKAMRRGDAQAGYNLAHMLQSTDPEYSLKCYFNAAFLGHSSAMTVIAEEHIEGRRLEFDTKTAITWLKQGVEDGDEYSQVLLSQYENEYD
eukprot:TRINITY_DN1060_c0_g1_i1.p1 TRINITY_DN1060_c0_g1~~TRINITY_DN1060_c0_g1_i1.p1  ORF type:complete len:482 (-),score=119.93 TRINITY_DN1060_c0_g1_i1:39-1484(-)